jgi:hypothetical protein
MNTDRLAVFIELHERILTLEKLFKYRSIVAKTINQTERDRDIQDM